MPEYPLVSIITPSYNQGQFIDATIQSVLGQDYAPIEYLIIDGGSTDNSLEVIRRYEDQIAYWESQPDRGQAHAINKGLQHANGEILGWLNSDDVLLPDTVSRVVSAFGENPHVDVVYGRLERIDASGSVAPTPILPKDRVTFDKSLVVGECVVNQPGCFWRRGIMDTAGYLNDDLHYGLDYEYWIRLALAGAIFMRLPNVVAYFRLSQESKTVSQTTQMAEEQLDILDELLEREDLPKKLSMSPDQLRQQAKRTRANIQLHAFYGAVKSQEWGAAWKWLSSASREDPTAIFQQRWIDLAIASLRRRLH